MDWTKMTKIRLLVLIVASIAAFGSVSEQADAQQTYRPLKQVNRWLGHWHNHGYHYRNPGPDVSYYNPYSAHNSRLVGQEYRSSYGNGGNYGNSNAARFPYGGGLGNTYDLNAYGQNSYGQNNFGSASQYNSGQPTPSRNNDAGADDDRGDNYDDEPDPSARPVESSIEGEVQPMGDLDNADDSISPGDAGSTFLPIDSPADSEVIPSSSPSNRTPDPYWDNQTSSRVPLNGPIRN